MAWLDSAAVIASDPETRAAVCSGEQVCLAFPRNWPAAFTSTGALKLLVNKSLRGTRCRAVDVAAESATEEGLDTSDSFTCSAQLASASGLVVIKGFVVFECIGPGEGTLGFVAFRHWWNASSGGAWLDRSQPLVPASSGDGRVLLVESALEDGEVNGAERARACTSDAALRAHLTRVALREQQRSGSRADAGPGGAAADPHGGGGLARLAHPSQVRAAIQPPETTAVHKDGGTSATTLSFEAHGDADVGESGDGDTVSADAECDPADPEACLQLAATLRAEGIALFDRGHVGGAKGRFETAADARIHAAQAAKEEGNSCFRRADGSGATAHYERALAALGCGPRPGHLKRVPPQPYDYHYDCGVADAEGDPATVEFARILRLRTPVKLITALHSNAAASCLLEQRFDTARAAATSALRIDPNHTKSRSRRAAAFQALGQHSAACEDLALALAASMGTPAAAELASQLIQQWRLRAPCICKYVDETCARHAKAGAQGAVMALVRALHGIGSAADWARNTPMPGCGLTPDGERGAPDPILPAVPAC